MSNELILAVVLTVVLVADLLIRSFRNKNKIDDSPKIGEETSKKHRFNFKYFINRKRNIITFIMLGLIFKPAVHYQFFTEFENYINTDKKLPASEKREEFYKLSKINHNVVKSYAHLFYVKKWNFDIQKEEIFPLVKFAKNYYLKTDEFDLSKVSFNGTIDGNKLYNNKTYWNVLDESSYHFNPELNKIGNKFLYTPYNPENELSMYAGEYCSNINFIGFKEKSFFYKDYNIDKIFFIYPNVYVSNNIKKFSKYNNRIVYQQHSFRDPNSIDDIFTKYHFRFYKDFEFIEKKDPEPLTKMDTIEGYLKMMESGMYMDYKTKLLYDTLGNQVVTEKDGKMVNFFIHPQDLRKSDFMFHFDNIFKLKLWLFSISFSFMGLFVFLFNDKIQAR